MHVCRGGELGIWLQIAMWGGNAAEAASLQLRLSEAVSNQRRLVMWRWLLSAVTYALDYCGAVLNFVCVALPIATGTLPSETEQT